MAELRELIAKAKALKHTGDAKNLDALIKGIKTKLISGETTGDEVLNYVILHKGSLDEGKCGGLTELKSRLLAHVGEPFIMIDTAERAHVSNPSTEDYIIEVDTWGAVAFGDTLRLPRDRYEVVFDCPWPVKRKDRYARKWRFMRPEEAKGVTVYQGADFDMRYGAELNLVNNRNRRFDGERIYSLDIIVGTMDVQRYFMEQSMGIEYAEMDRMLGDQEKNKEPLGRMFVKAKAQWEGLLKSLRLDIKDGRYGLNPELVALEKYKPSIWRWFF
ncbi:MAG: hypothetical protein JXA30_05905 [Deltaproteobacteria bacterium]|nr:hypothetical protein [Deltaproteobacteria bacterium]